MSKTYQIFKPEDLKSVFHKLDEYIKLRESRFLDFQKMTLVCKRYQKPKSSAQLKKYWVLISKLKPHFIEAGYRVNEEDISQYVKARAGHTKIINSVVFTKSISDASDEDSMTALSNLIEFIIEMAAQDFDVDLESDRCIV